MKQNFPLTYSLFLTLDKNWLAKGPILNFLGKPSKY